MENIFKLLGIGSLLVFSFFYITKTNTYLINNSDLLSVINDNKSEYEVSAVDAVVYGDYIIPGIKGQSINVLESYYKMSPYDVFVQNFLVYEEVYPEISITNNLDKYIEKGNSTFRNITFVIENNEDVINFLEIYDIKANHLVTLENYKNSSFERINNDIENFFTLDSEINNKICIVNDLNENLCKENKYYLIKINTYLENSNYSEIKNNIYSGQIIFIANDLKLVYFESLYLEILFRGYEIVTLPELINE